MGYWKEDEEVFRVIITPPKTGLVEQQLQVQKWYEKKKKRKNNNGDQTLIKQQPEFLEFDLLLYPTLKQFYSYYPFYLSLSLSLSIYHYLFSLSLVSSVAFAPFLCYLLYCVDFSE